MILPVEDRFWKNTKIAGPDECWEWTAYTDKDGYGKMSLGNKKNGRAHRVSYELNQGPIPVGLSVLHRCDNPKCVNPNHLFLGTNKDNIDDKVTKGRNAVLAGELSPSAKLNAKQVSMIREDNRVFSDIAAEYKIDKSTVSGIKSGKYWKCLQGAAP